MYVKKARGRKYDGPPSGKLSGDSVDHHLLCICRHQCCWEVHEEVVQYMRWRCLPSASVSTRVETLPCWVRVSDSQWGIIDQSGDYVRTVFEDDLGRDGMEAD
ncbi:hypothetical protein JB92DRAFT_2837862 [Gautieria morchelliformis]|nr:hypothetical protein JB92DRAFT_2837862 [Gautieria morchelliformis]